MKSTLYIIAVLLIASWFIGNYVFAAGNLIHVLLVLSVVSVLLARTGNYENV